MDFISDLQRSFMPLPESFLQEIEVQDQFLLAFPRCGSRWMILLLSDLANAAFGLEEWDYNALVELATIGQTNAPWVSSFLTGTVAIPNAHSRSRDASLLIQHGRIPVFRSHHLAEVILRSNGPIVYVVRHPAPALYSYYRFARGRGDVSESMTLEEFCHEQLPLWKDHVSTMLALHKAAPGRVLFLTYREPGPFVKAQLEASANHLRIPAESATIDRALSRMTDFFDKVNAHPATPHARGRNSPLMKELPDALQHWIRHDAQELFDDAVQAEGNGP